MEFEPNLEPEQVVVKVKIEVGEDSEVELDYFPSENIDSIDPLQSVIALGEEIALSVARLEAPEVKNGQFFWKSF